MTSAGMSEPGFIHGPGGKGRGRYLKMDSFAGVEGWLESDVLETLLST